MKKYFQPPLCFHEEDFFLNNLNFSEASIDASKNDCDMDQDSEENLLNDDCL